MPIRGLTLAVLVAGVGLFVFGLSHKTQAEKPLEVNWLIAHEPVYLFDRAAKDFALEFNKTSDRPITVHILGPSDYGSTNARLSSDTVFQALDGGQVQLATLVTDALSRTQVPQLGVLQLPFLFTDTKSAERVLDGAIGDHLLQDITDATSARGLAFTFSGGLMVIESNTHSVQSLADFKNLRIGTIEGPIAMATLKAFGASPEKLDVEKGKYNGSLLSTLDGIETPYTRINLNVPEATPSYVSETNHSLFLTVIMASDSFYESLSPNDRIALLRAARVAAQDEREDSVALAAKNRELLKERGATVTIISPDVQEALKKAVASVYTTFAPQFDAALLKGIQEAQR